MIRLVLASVLVGLVSTAAADVPDAAKASALFEEGNRLMDGNQPDAACVKFEASYKLDPQLGTKLNVAVCRERAGKLVEAYHLFDEAAAEAQRTAKAGRETFARQRLAALTTKLARYRLTKIDPIAGLAITVGGRPVAQADWAREQIVEPSTIVVELSAPGRKPARVEKAMPAGSQIEIELPALAAIAIVDHHEPHPPDAPIPVRRAAGPHRAPAYLVGGTGTALLLGSIGIGLHSRVRYDDAKSAGDVDRVSSAQHEANIGTVVGIVGVVAIGAGVVLYLRAGKSRVVVTPTTGDGARITLVGAF